MKRLGLALIFGLSLVFNSPAYSMERQQRGFEPNSRETVLKSIVSLCVMFAISNKPGYEKAKTMLVVASILSLLLGVSEVIRKEYTREYENFQKNLEQKLLCPGALLFLALTIYYGCQGE